MVETQFRRETSLTPRQASKSPKPLRGGPEESRRMAGWRKAGEFPAEVIQKFEHLEI